MCPNGTRLTGGRETKLSAELSGRYGQGLHPFRCSGNSDEPGHAD